MRKILYIVKYSINFEKKSPFWPIYSKKRERIPGRMNSRDIGWLGRLSDMAAGAGRFAEHLFIHSHALMTRGGRIVTIVTKQMFVS
jgi:hypothetical protein